MFKKSSLLFAMALVFATGSAIGSANARGFHGGVYIGIGPCCYLPPPCYYGCGYYVPMYQNVPPPLPQAPMPAQPYDQGSNQRLHSSIGCVDGRSQIIQTAAPRQDTPCR